MHIIQRKGSLENLSMLSDIITQFLSGRQLSPSTTPPQQTSIMLHRISRNQTTGQRQRHLQFLIRVFGIDGVSVLFYELLSVRAYNSMITSAQYIHRLQEFKETKRYLPLNVIATLTAKEICKIRNSGPTTVHEVDSVLRQFGLRINMSANEVREICFPEPTSKG
ncbi:MAG: hypothetical protein HZC01_04315 [Candidatus Kerfeldbacteria bacterium]|nr:hypothetical protein [Candidatus Kerfeldbacteria bacterium]